MNDQGYVHEIAILKLKQSIESYRAQMSLMVQLSTVLIIADSTMVGYAIQKQMAGIIWIALVLALALIILNEAIFKLVVPILVTAVAIEARFPDPDADGLVTNFVSVRYSSEFLNELRNASRLDTLEKRSEAQSNIRDPNQLLRVRSFGDFKKVIPKLFLYLILAAHIMLPIYLVHHFEWGLWTAKDSQRQTQETPPRLRQSFLEPIHHPMLEDGN